MICLEIYLIMNMHVPYAPILSCLDTGSPTLCQCYQNQIKPTGLFSVSHLTAERLIAVSLTSAARLSWFSAAVTACSVSPVTPDLSTTRSRFRLDAATWEGGRPEAATVLAGDHFEVVWKQKPYCCGKQWQQQDRHS